MGYWGSAGSVTACVSECVGYTLTSIVRCDESDSIDSVVAEVPPVV